MVDTQRNPNTWVRDSVQMCKVFHFHRRLGNLATRILLLELVTDMAAGELVHFTKLLFHIINLYFLRDKTGL